MVLGTGLTDFIRYGRLKRSAVSDPKIQSPYQTPKGTEIRIEQ